MQRVLGVQNVNECPRRAQGYEEDGSQGRCTKCTDEIKGTGCNDELRTKLNNKIKIVFSMLGSPL